MGSGPNPRIRVGDTVQLRRRRPYGAEGVVTAETGDRGQVVRVGRHGCAVDFGGIVTVVLYDDVELVTRGPGHRRPGP